MKREVQGTWRRIVAPITLVAVAGLVVGLAGCFLFNVSPEAGFTIGPSTAGTAPFTVNLSAAPSSDPDGEIEKYSWDFGDGSQGTGRNVAHTYTTPGTFTIVLTVEDKYGATDQALKNVFVTAPEPAGPTARFTASPSSGTSPLTVTFNAAASTYDAGTIVSYDWSFGDGATGFGLNTTHTYFSATTQTFTVTLTVRGADGKLGSTTATVRVTPPGGGGTTPPAAGAPSARFAIDQSIGVGPFLVRFDPADSEATEGRVIILYTWSFGDGDATSTVNPSVQEHVYVTDSPSEVFSVTLVVLDNQGASNTITKTVKIYNHRPVAGFDIANPPGGDKDNAGVVEYATALAAYNAGLGDPNVWAEDDVVYGDIFSNNGLGGAFPVEITVVIRSRALTAAWYTLNNTANQATLRQANGTLATSSTVPGAPNDSAGNGYNDHNYSYDPEGQAWAGAAPAWFAAPTNYGQAWGIRYLYVNWGDGTGDERIDYAAAGAAFFNNAIMTHDYQVTADGTVRIIKVTAEDWLGQKSAEFSRRVTLKVGYETTADEI